MGGDRVQMFSVWGAMSPCGEGTQRRKAAGQGTNASVFGAPNHQAGRGRKDERRRDRVQMPQRLWRQITRRGRDGKAKGGGTRYKCLSVWGAKSPGGEGTQRRKAAGRGTNASAFGAPNHQAGRGRKGERRRDGVQMPQRLGRRITKRGGGGKERGGGEGGGREAGEERREEVRWER